MAILSWIFLVKCSRLKNAERLCCFVLSLCEISAFFPRFTSHWSRNWTASECTVWTNRHPTSSEGMSRQCETSSSGVATRAQVLWVCWSPTLYASATMNQPYGTGWQRGSVVRTSVFGWWTFPDLRLIYGWHVTTSWVKCVLWVCQPGQLSLPSLRVR